MTVALGVELWLGKLRREGRHSPATLREYTRDLSAFAASFAGGGIDRLDAIWGAEVGCYLSGLAENLSASSRSRRLSALRMFFAFTTSERWTKCNPALSVSFPTHPTPPPRILTYEEVQEVIRAPDRSFRLGLRNSAMLSLLYAAGMRISELVRLHIGDLDFERGLVRLPTKGRDDRFLPVRDEALLTVRTYVLRARPELLASNAPAQQQGSSRPASSLLFVTPRSGPLHPHTVARVLRVAARRVGIVGPLGPDILRRSYAVHLVDGGVELRVVQALLGQRAIASTTRYARAATTAGVFGRPFTRRPGVAGAGKGSSRPGC